MSKLTHTHAMLLATQLASVFKYVNDLGHHREAFTTFEDLPPSDGPGVTFKYVEHPKKGRSSVDVHIVTEKHRFYISQWFNYGILLELEVNYQNRSGSSQSLLTYLLDAEEDEYTQGLIYDFEYGVSIFTEHMAHVLSKRE